MAQFITGVIKLSDLTEAFKSGHSAFWTAKTGNKFANIKIFIDEDRPDKFENTVNIQLNAKQGSTEKTVYVGEGKVMATKGSKLQTADSFANTFDDSDSLPF